MALDADSGSGSIRLAGGKVQGSVAPRRITGTIAGGGPFVHLSSRSGGIRITLN